MVQEITIKDDITGEEVPAGRKPVKFVVEGKSYSLDLTAANEKKLRTALLNLEKAQSAIAVFTAKGGSGAASATQNKSATPRKKSKTKGASRSDLPQIREWAAANGYELGKTGRIPGPIQDAYDAAKKRDAAA